MKPNHHLKRLCAFIPIAGLIFAGIHSRSGLLNPLKTSPVEARTKVQSGRQREETSARIVRDYGKLPLLFEANRGQTDARVKYLARGDGYALFLTPNEAALRLRIADRGSRIVEADSCPTEITDPRTAILRMELINANPAARSTGRHKGGAKSNYLIGADPRRWIAGISNFNRVKFDEVWPGIDMVYYGNQRQLEYDFVVAPGARADRIKLSFDGAGEMKI